MATLKQQRSMPVSHTAGIYADMTLDGPEIGTLVAVVDRAKNLPNRKTMGKQDPYCAMRVGKEAKKTGTDRRGGQTPKWDQELRFTVHDTPDYYKLKCSIFNDDKKTDLIGEAWIDLTELIVPGGGQNDLWHQLNFKGRYAGDIRIEMTYYDTRVNLELEAQKQKQREKTNSNGSELSSASGARQLGPRDVQRRPLPPGPHHSAPAELPHPLRIQHRHSEPPPPPPPPSHPHAHPSETPPIPRQSQQYTPPESPDDFPRVRYGYSQSNQSFHQSYDNVNHPEYDQSYDGRPGHQSPQSGQYYPSEAPHPDIRYALPEPQPRYSDPGPPSSHAHPTSSPQSAYNSSPPSHQASSSSYFDQRQQRMSTSPTKYATYRDSPLRQSTTHHHISSIAPTLYQPPPNDDLPSPPPPPPPAHRGSLPRANKPPSYNTSPRDSSHRDTQQFGTIEDRSPLQMLEHQYSPNVQPQSPRDTRRGRNSSQIDSDPYLEGSPTEIAGDFPAPHQLSPNYGVDLLEEPIQQDHRGRYIRRNSNNGAGDSSFHLPPRAQTFDSAETFDERHTYRSQPQVVRPRAISPDQRPVVPRKSVSPRPPAPEERNRFNGVPFGPDSYDVLNPSPAPATRSYMTSEQTKEADRQREVDRLREQGPIIGNDGRVIDPSDHLPSDTWAPEPERKNRQPEHVIRIRTKEEARNSRPGSSPMPIKPLSAGNSPYTNSPLQAPSSSPNSGQRRNRLQKTMPQRPLPTQPYSHAQTSPASIPLARPPQPPPPQRNSAHSSPMSSPPHRPPLSEYQVAAGNNYNPRGPYPPQHHYQTTPTKAPPRPHSYAAPQTYKFNAGPGSNPNHYDDPLAAEMSMIDIGPSRGGGRTALRSGRSYGGY